MKSVLISVITRVNAEDRAEARSILDSFRRQTWPHKELIFVGASDNDSADGVRCVKLAEGENWIERGADEAHGHLCVLWTPGWWYHEDVLAIHAQVVDPLVRVELRDNLNQPPRSISFFRRSAKFLYAPQMTRREIGGAGLAQRIETNSDPEGWKLYHSGNYGDIIYSMPALKVLDQAAITWVRRRAPSKRCARP